MGGNAATAWAEADGDWLWARSTSDNSGYAACATDGTWVVHQYESHSDPDKSSTIFAEGEESSLKANMAAADKQLAAAGWTMGGLTPSEVALSKVLAAWVEWWVAAPSCGPDGDCMSDVGLSLIKRGMVNRNGTTSPAGAALLDRARKAGVL